MEKCQNCPFDTYSVQGYGPENAELMFIGQAPGKEEVRKGRPFIGRSGSLLRAALDEVGIDMDDHYTTNAVACRLPFEEDPPIDTCHNRLEKEIKEIDPQGIVTFGTDAWKSVFETDCGVMSVRGRWFYSEKYEAYVIPTLHPASCLYHTEPDGSPLRDLYSDLKSLSDRLVSGSLTVEDIYVPHNDDLRYRTPRINYSVLDSVDQAKDFYRFSVDLNTEYIAADIESTGLTVHDDILCIGFCWKPGHAVILTPEAIDREALPYFLTETDIDFVWHNGKFDVKLLRENGIDAEVHEDTMLLSYSLDERSGVHGLEYIAGQMFNAPKWEEKFKEKHIKDGSYEDVPGEVLYEYNALDVHYTHRIFQQLRDKVDGQLRSAYENILIPASNALADVESHGFHLDVEYMQEVEEEWKQKIEECRKPLMDYVQKYGWSTERYVEETTAKSEPDEINFNSDKQMWHVFFDLVGLPQYQGRRTIAQTARNWMRSKVTDQEKLDFLDAYEKYKKLRHSFDLYVKGLQRRVEEDGKIRSDYSLHRTMTGRLSSRKPNLQNISRKPTIKKAFVCPEGRVLVEADYSQAELRTLAVLSGDEFLQNVYHQGRDLHDEMSDRLWGEGEWVKEERTVTKNIQFGIIYGIGPKGVANRSDVSEKKAQEMIYQWYENAPGAAEYFKECEQQALEEGEVYSYTGRCRRFPLKKNNMIEEIRRKARNHRIQSAASDITLLSGINLSKRWMVINLVHDSVVIECDEEDVKAVGEDCIDTMPRIAQETLDTDLPFKVDIEVGKNWGEMEEVDIEEL